MVIYVKYLYKRIIAGASALVTSFFTCRPPANALGLPDVEVNLDVVDFGDWLYSCRNSIFNFAGSFFDEDICPYSPNNGGRHNFIEQRTTVNGKTGLYYVCEYCGKSAGEVVKEAAYDNQVSELPAQGITSSGGLIWQVTVANLVSRSLSGGSSDRSFDVSGSNPSDSSISLCGYPFSSASKSSGLWDIRDDKIGS